MPTTDARNEILDLLARVVYEGDGGSLDAYGALLTADISWTMPGVEHHGLDAVLAGMAERRATGIVGPGSGVRHVLTTSAVDLAPGADPAHATVRSTWLLLAAPDGDPDGATVRRFGCYHDTVRRTDVGWRLAARRITFGAS